MGKKPGAYDERDTFNNPGFLPIIASKDFQDKPGAALFAVVGQFFGRIGNSNGDVIGYPTNLPWGVVYAYSNSFAPRHDLAYSTRLHSLALGPRFSI